MKEFSLKKASASETISMSHLTKVWINPYNSTRVFNQIKTLCKVSREPLLVTKLAGSLFIIDKKKTPEQRTETNQYQR